MNLCRVFYLINMTRHRELQEEITITFCLRAQSGYIGWHWISYFSPHDLLERHACPKWALAVRVYTSLGASVHTRVGGVEAGRWTEAGGDWDVRSDFQ